MSKEYNGYAIREAITRWSLRRDIAEQEFKNSVWAFENENKSKPVIWDATLKAADEAIARLQCLQQIFNLQVIVKVLEEEMNLAMVTKLIGGAGRREKMWRTAIKDTGKEKYARSSDKVRKTDEIFATKQITAETGKEETAKALKYAGALRAALSTGNARKITVTDESMIAILDT